MIRVPFDEIDKSVIEDLLHNNVPEGKTLDYKLILPDNGDEKKKEFRRDVSSFANAAGGYLIYGVVEEGGIPREICGVETADPDAEILRLEQMIRDGIDPRLPGVHIKPVPGFSKGPVFVVHITRSWMAPHMVTFKNQSPFFSRNSAGKYPLDSTEIKQAFLLSEGLTRQIERFRDDRISRIVADDGPLPLRPGPKVVLHLFPFSAAEPTTRTDMEDLFNRSMRIDPMFGCGSTSRYNLDGVVRYRTHQDQGISGYVQFFRTGAVESVATDIVSSCGSHDEARAFLGVWFCRGISKALEQYLAVLKDLSIDPPAFIFLTVLWAKGFSMTTELAFGGAPIDRDILAIPEVLVDDFSRSPDEILREPFDMLWQAAGYGGCPLHNEAGRLR